MLVARSFDARTSEALDFLLQHKLPVQILKIAFYLDEGDRRFLDIEWETEPESLGAPSGIPGSGGIDEPAGPASYLAVTLLEVTASVVTPATLVWNRPKKGAEVRRDSA